MDLYAQHQLLLSREHDDGVTSAGNVFSMGFATGVAF
jgi:hypothetical protein